MKLQKILSIATLFLYLLPSPVFAATPVHPAGKIINQALEDVLQRLSDPQIHTNGPTQGKLLKEIEDIIYARLDFEEFSARTVGAVWRDFTAEQRTDFQLAIRDLLYYTYFKNLLQYHGEPVEYVGEIVSPKGDKVEVKTNFIHQGKPIPINYRMLNKNGDWLVYDMFIESVSIVQNYRGQFQQILQKEKPEQLITLIREKADEIKDSADAALTATQN